MKTAKRHLTKRLLLDAPALLALAAVLMSYIVLHPKVTAPYVIGPGIFAAGVVAWLLWLAARMGAYLQSADEEA